MYRPKRSVKRIPELQWALPDRIFFACGACHILAYAFLERFPAAGYRAIWMKPAQGFTGNHVVATDGSLAFDFHGCSRWDELLLHAARKNRRWMPGWNCSLVELPAEALVSEAKSRTYEGLWLRGPEQFLHDALPRARAFSIGSRTSCLDMRFGSRTGAGGAAVVSVTIPSELPIAPRPAKARSEGFGHPVDPVRTAGAAAHHPEQRHPAARP
jgi:hypothetical protein